MTFVPQILPVIQTIDIPKATLYNPKDEKRIPNSTATTKQILTEPKTVEFETYSILRSKIDWAAKEMKNSDNIRYNIELCELIKAVSETIISLKNVDC